MLITEPRNAAETAAYMTELRINLKAIAEAPAEEMAAFFARRIKDYDNVHMENWGKEYAHISEYFSDEPETLLDLGCGTGLELTSIYQRFPSVAVTAIDLSSAMLERLQEKFANKKIEVIQGDYFEIPFEERKFDAALSVETLHHFKFAKKQHIYEKLYQSLEHGGSYIECDYYACCQEEENLCLALYEAKRKENQISDNEFIHIDIPLTKAHQLELLQRSGFSEIQVMYERESTVILRAKK